jgi:hypothetical protein
MLCADYFDCACPVKFQARHNALIFPAADVDKPFVTHNAELPGMVAPQLEAELAEQISEKTIHEQVKGVLKRLLAGQRPGLHDVARAAALALGRLSASGDDGGSLVGVGAL